MAEEARTTASEVAQLNDIAVSTGMSHAQVLEVAGVFDELKRLTTALEASEAARANLEAVIADAAKVMEKGLAEGATRAAIVYDVINTLARAK